ncbi:hypothetical protein BJX99DRAFT_241819 [Aspergillus californicus]
MVAIDAVADRNPRWSDCHRVLLIPITPSGFEYFCIRSVMMFVKAWRGFAWD